MSRVRIGGAFGFALVAVVLAVHVVVVLRGADETLLNGDTSQLLSSGLNLFAGRGYATDAVFFANQLERLPLPAPQTVWPPGLAVLLAALVGAGLPPYAAALALSLAGFVLVVALTAALATTIRLGPLPAALVAACAAATSLFGVLAVRGFADSLFVASTLASAWLLLHATVSRHPIRVVLAAGTFAALAFSIRYAALAWIAAGAVCVLAPHGLREPRRALAQVLAFCLVPALAVTAAFVRNLALAGTLTGAPELGGGQSPAQVVRQFHWSGLRLLGAFDNPGEMLVEGLGLLALSGGLALAWRHLTLGRRRAPSRAGALATGHGGADASTDVSSDRSTDRSTGRASRFVVLVGTYVGATLALLSHQSFTAYPDFVQPRYLLPMLPFALLAGGLVAARAGRAGAWLGSLAVACFVAGQLHAGAESLASGAGHEQTGFASRLAAAPPGGPSLLDRLVAETSRERPLTSGDVQFLTGLHRIPTVSLPAAPFADRIWDEGAVRALMARSGSCLLLLDAGRGAGYERARLPFFSDLLSGHEADWLSLEHTADGLLLYRRAGCRTGS